MACPRYVKHKASVRPFNYPHSEYRACQATPDNGLSRRRIASACAIAAEPSELGDAATQGMWPAWRSSFVRSETIQ
jgi:hypothetical protein